MSVVDCSKTVDSDLINQQSLRQEGQFEQLYLEGSCEVRFLQNLSNLVALPSLSLTYPF